MISHSISFTPSINADRIEVFRAETDSIPTLDDFIQSIEGVKQIAYDELSKVLEPDWTPTPLLKPTKMQNPNEQKETAEEESAIEGEPEDENMAEEENLIEGDNNEAIIQTDKEDDSSNNQ